MTITTQKQQVLDLLKSIETGNEAALDVIHPTHYIQHNLGVPDGVDGFRDLIRSAPPGTRVNTVRVFQDGDHVFTHSEFEFFGPKVGFDIFRFENGKVVEHWDNEQERPEQLNQSGRSMTDGATDATDLEDSAKNKSLVQAFVTHVLINRRVDQLPTFVDGDSYAQHNPQLGDSLSGLRALLQGTGNSGITLSFTRIHKVLGEGNFVLVVSEGELNGKPSSFYDLFRVQGGKLAEHWDTVETIPPRPEWKNGNGKF